MSVRWLQSPVVPRLRPHTAVAVCLLVFSAAGLAGEAGATPPDVRCDEAAKEAFRSGIKQYARRQWEAAIPGLSRAADRCPMAPWIIKVFDFGEYHYVPFYYLGKCNYGLNDRDSSFKALRNFYLSSCLTEPTRHDGPTKDLDDLTKECRTRLADQRQLQQHPPEFNEGLKAFDRDWGKAAENMWDALQIESDDGQMKLSARWPDPYLPGLRLAKALAKLGCIREACRQYDRFQFKDLILKNGPKDKYKDERQVLEMLGSECAGPNRELTPNNETCQRWRCWLGEGRP